MKRQIWITNISKHDVFLYDLNLVIKAKRSINLLGLKKSHLTLDQINHSINSGSIFDKSNKIKIGHSSPSIRPQKTKFINEYPIATRQRSIVEIEREKELEFDETKEKEIEMFAEENIDLLDTYRKK